MPDENPGVSARHVEYLSVSNGLVLSPSMLRGQFILLLCLFCFAGCEAHFEINAKGKLLQKVDETFDDLDQRRQETTQSLVGLRNRLSEVRKAKVKVGVQADLLSRKIEGVKRRKDGTAQVSALQDAQERLKKAADTLERKQIGIERALAVFEGKVAVIDSHRAALAAMRRAAEALDGAGGDLADLQAKIEDLEAEAKVEVAGEQARIDTEDLGANSDDLADVLPRKQGR